MTKFASVEELRQDTPRLLAEVEAGLRFVITKRGESVTVLVPSEPSEERCPPVRPSGSAWEDVAPAVRQGEPAYPTVEEALGHSRRRPSPGRHMLETGNTE